MKLYHGSDVAVSAPDVNHSREKIDFGRGFYVTPVYEQAVKWAERFKNNRVIRNTLSFSDSIAL